MVNKLFLFVLLLSSLAFSDIVAFRDGISDSVKILDTVGCHVKILRYGAPFSIDKEKLGFVVINLDTITYEAFVCTEARKSAEREHLMTQPDSLGNKKSQYNDETNNYDGTIRLTKRTTLGYSAPMMGANGMMMGGGMPYAKSIDCFEVYGDNKDVGFSGESLKPYLNPKSDALKYLGYFQGQKIGAIGCYTGSFILAMVALFAGQDDAGTSYGYDPQSGGFGNTRNTRINGTFAPSISGSCICLITGLVLQFTARSQLVKAVKIHNESILKNRSKSEQ